MAAIVGIISRHGLRIEICCRNQSINKSKLSLYIRNRTERFSYKGGCGVHGHTRAYTYVSRCLYKELTWTIDKWLQVISITSLEKLYCTTKKLKKFKEML